MNLKKIYESVNCNFNFNLFKHYWNIILLFLNIKKQKTEIELIINII
jgi:hypothetical protein